MKLNVFKVYIGNFVKLHPDQISGYAAVALNFRSRNNTI